MIKMLHTKRYKRNMCSNKVECIKSAGPYCKMHDANMPFFMPAFGSNRIILHRFHIDKNEGKSVIEYDMIIGRDLMVKISLSADFKHQGLQWVVVTLPMK